MLGPAIISRRPRPTAGLLSALLAGAVAWGALLAPSPARAQYGATGGQAPRLAGAQDAILKKVRLDQRLDAQVPLDTSFRDETGREVRLGEYFGEKPVALVLIQYRCTMLCNVMMNVLLDSMKELKFTPGDQFNLLIVSIDPREGPDLAAEMKQSYLNVYGRSQASPGWHYLTGKKEAIDRLAASLGYHYEFDKDTDQFAHPDGVIVATPKGRVARYFFRLEYPPRDLRYGLIEAASNRIGTPLDAIALLCFHYNPVTGKYGLALLGLVRLLGAATVIAVAAAITVMRLRERHVALRAALPGTRGQG